MSTPQPRRLTIGHVMILIAGLAILWGLVRSPDLGRFLVGILIPLSLVISIPVLVINHLVDGSFGVRCPHCGQPTLERRTVASFGARFYLCQSCGVRCKRGAFGTWSDASGLEHDAKYRKKNGEDPWSAPPGLEDEDLIYSKTHGNLIRNKRRRKPDNPNGPGLE